MGRSITGTVISDKSDKTIVIKVVSRKTHPLYKKQYTVQTKFIAHDENNKARVGDTVTIVETRPMSARKRFMLDKVVAKAGVTFEDTDANAGVPTEPKAESQKPKAQEDKLSAKTKEESVK